MTRDMRSITSLLLTSNVRASTLTFVRPILLQRQLSQHHPLRRVSWQTRIQQLHPIRLLHLDRRQMWLVSPEFSIPRPRPAACPKYIVADEVKFSNASELWSEIRPE